jgi:hypothetical protein
LRGDIIPTFPHLRFWSRPIRRIAPALLAATLVHVADAATVTPKHNPERSTVKAMTFAKGALDHKHSFYWRGWTIAFGASAPYGAFQERGMEIHGLRCAQPGAKQLGCHLLMVMSREESRPHYCEILPDSARAEGPWPLLIACPGKIAWVHKAP